MRRTQLHIVALLLVAVYAVAPGPAARRVPAAQPVPATPRAALRPAPTEKELRRIAAPYGEIFALAFSPDGRLLASGSADSAIHLWEARTGKQRRWVRGHHGQVLTLAFAPDGQTLASGSQDRTIGLWDATTGKCRRLLRGHRGAVVSLAYSPDGRFLASAGADNSVWLWDPATGKQVRRYPGRQTVVQSVTFSPNGQTLVTGGHWVIGGMQLGGFFGGTRGVDGFCGGFGGGGFQGGWVSSAEVIGLFEVATGREVRGFGRWAPGSSASALAFSPNGRTLAVGSRQVLGVQGGFYQLSGFQGALGMTGLGGGVGLSGGFGFGGNLGMVGGFGGNLGLGGGFHGFGNMGLSGVHGLGTGPTTTCLGIWEGATGTERWHWHSLAGAVRTVAFSPDGKVVAAGTEGSNILLWDAGTGTLLRQLAGHQVRVNAIAFAPDGTTLASGGCGNVIQIWKVPVPRKERLARSTPRDWDGLWNTLTNGNASAAHRAMAALVTAAGPVEQFFQQRLRASSRPQLESLDRLIAELGHDRFQVRRRATLALEGLSEIAEPALRRALQGQPDLEVRYRVERLLGLLARRPPSGDYLRALRVLEALEQRGTPRAKEVLEWLADEKPASWLAPLARNALKRCR